MSDILTATRTLVGEARGETFDGQVAVAWVIRNRAASPGWWGGPDWESVCKAPWQFSCWNEAKYGGQKDLLNSISKDNVLDDPVYRRCLRAVIRAYDGTIVDLTDGATHYVVSSWLKDPGLRPSWADELSQVAEIGAHSFFRR